MKSKIMPICFRFILSVLISLLFLPIAGAQVSTVAGGYVGDGGQATSANLSAPYYGTADAQGNIYISDLFNCRIRKVDSQGNISTIAGTGICGFSGDGGKAIQAQISFSYGIVVDNNGNIFFADMGNERIREINSHGVINTIAGNGKSRYCGDHGPAVKACLNYITALAIGGKGASEALYIADTHNNRIRKVALKSGIITTVAGNGTRGYSGDGGPAKKASLNEPEGVAVYDSPHTLWISDFANSAIRKVDLQTGIITTLVGGDNCATLCFPSGMALDSAGNIYVAEFGPGMVVSVQVANGTNQIIIELGGSGTGYNGDGIPAVNAWLQLPFDVAIDRNGDLLTFDAGEDRVRKGMGNENISTVAGGYAGDGHRGTAAALNYPGAAAFDRNGNLYIADTSYDRVRMVDKLGKITTFAGTGTSGFSGDGGPASQAQLHQPMGLVFDPQGNLFIGDLANGAVRKVDTSGTITTFAGGGQNFMYAASLAIDTQGNIYAADSASCLIWRIAPDATTSIVAGEQFQCGYNFDNIPATQAELNYPSGVAVDAKGNIYIGDSNNHRIRLVNTQGIISTIAGTGGCGFTGDGGPATNAELCYPAGVTFDHSGTLYLADSGNLRIRMIDGKAIIHSVAGSGRNGYNGNKLSANKTNMQPWALAFSPSGELYYSDQSDYRVRKVQ